MIDIRLYLDDILTSIRSVQDYTDSLSEEEFAKDRKTFEAVAFNLQIIGEASKQIPEDYRAAYPQIDRKKVVGLRNVITHAYFSLSESVILDIAQNKLDDLADCITQMEKQMESEMNSKVNE